MPNAVGGWTGSTIGPSYQILSQILGPAGGPSGATTPSNLANTSPVTPGFGAFTGVGGIPSVPAVQPSGGGGGFGGGLMGGGTVQSPTVGRSGGGRGGPTGITDQAGNPIYTPEQSYSMYLQTLGGATARSPQMDILRQIININQQLAYNPSTNQGYVPTRSNDPYTMGLQNQLNTLQTALPIANKYSYAYGAPAANAPAATPAWGYPVGYGEQPPGTSTVYQPRQPNYSQAASMGWGGGGYF